MKWLNERLAVSHSLVDDSNLLLFCYYLIYYLIFGCFGHHFIKSFKTLFCLYFANLLSVSGNSTNSIIASEQVQRCVLLGSSHEIIKRISIGFLSSTRCFDLSFFVRIELKIRVLLRITYLFETRLSFRVCCDRDIYSSFVFHNSF